MQSVQVRTVFYLEQSVVDLGAQGSFYVFAHQLEKFYGLHFVIWVHCEYSTNKCCYYNTSAIIFHIMKLVKRLTPLSDLHKRGQTQANELKECLNQITSTFVGLSEKIDKLSSRVFLEQEHKNGENLNKSSSKGAYENKNINCEFYQFLEDRFQTIDVPIPIQKLNKFGQQPKRRQEQILGWLGIVCKRVFSTGFKMLKTDQYEVNKIKAFCSENILRNIIKLSQIFQLTQNQFSKIDECLKNQLLPYFCYKYPQTEQKQVSTKFSGLLIQRDNIENNENDLVSKSSIKFEYHESGNYNSKIMEFFNYVITLPNQMIQNKNEHDKKTFAENFYIDVENIFKMVQSENVKKKMLEFDPKQALHIHAEQDSFINSLKNLIIKEESEQKDEKKMKLQKQYLEKVKSYTSYQIGRKISENFPVFTDYQIKSGNIKLSNSSIMRVVTKWCDELEKNFDQNYILNRQIQYKMKDGSQKYLSKFKSIILNYYLQRQKAHLDEKLKKIQKNNYSLQSTFSQQKTNPQLKIFSQQQAMVGSFCSSVFKINQNYLINYLNKLIHSINTALLSYAKFVQVEKQFSDIKQIFQENQNDLEYVIEQVQDRYKFVKEQHSLSYIPELITFKVGDLLRCRCSSKQSEIIALYREIERISLVNPGLLKIIRVKNKLDQGNKDILMNLLYRGTMVVEMQLAIKSQKTKFIQCSNKFNHYLYQMKRAKFGPLMEMCSIWISQDLRADFYLEKIMTLNQSSNKVKQEISKCCLKFNNLQYLKLPFKCFRCSRFYFECSPIQMHACCRSCQKKICFLCRFQQTSSKNKAHLIPQIDQNATFFKQLPPQGALYNLKSQQQKKILFKTIKINKQYYLFHQTINPKTKQPQIELIQKFKQKELPQSFLMTNLIFTSPRVQQLIPSIQINIRKIQYQYLVEKYLNQIDRKKKNSISIARKQLTEEFFGSSKLFRDKIWADVEKINFEENRFRGLNQIVYRFPNAFLLILRENRICELRIDSKLNWKNMKLLYLDNNQINKIQGIELLQNIVTLNLKKNNLQSLPQSLTLLKNLQNLNLQHNKISQIPKSIWQMKKLKILQLNNNSLKYLNNQICQQKSLKTLVLKQNGILQLPPSIGKLENLTTLIVSRNCLCQLPDSLGDLGNLQVLELGENRLKMLPELFCRLANLQKLSLEGNQIQILPQKFFQLSKLKQLNVSRNHIKEFSQSFGKLQSIIQLNAFQNKLQKLPKSFCNLQTLEKLQLSKNKINNLNENFSQLKCLKYLIVDHNNITKLPENFCKLESLINFSIESNKLQQLPESFSTLPCLQSLNLNKNALSSLHGLSSIQSLQHLSITHNSLQVSSFCKISTQTLNFPSLTHLSLSNNNLASLPQFYMPRLKSLQISNNKIEVLGDNFLLENLQHLDLRGNSITKMPQWIGKLPLKVLLLGGNRIGDEQIKVWEKIRQSQEGGSGRVRKLDILDLEHNLLRQLNLNDSMSMIMTNINIEEIKLAGNPIQRITVSMDENRVNKNSRMKFLKQLARITNDLPGIKWMVFIKCPQQTKNTKQFSCILTQCQQKQIKIEYK